MVWRKLPVWTVSAFGIILLLVLTGPISGQETPRANPESRKDGSGGSPTPPPAVPDTVRGVRERVCAYSISPENQSFPPARGTGAIAISANEGCAWTAASDSPWLKIESASSGTGSGVVKYSLSANTGISPRTATIAAAGRVFQVTQSAQATQGLAPPAAQSVTAPQCTLTIEKTGNGQGRVAGNPAGTVFRRGVYVHLYAVPEANSTFAGWGGSCSGTSKTCLVNMAADRAVTANFSLRTHTIHVRLPMNGVVHPSGAVKANHGEKRRFQVIPLPGYRVSEVLVDKRSVGAVNSYTFDNVIGDHVLEAIFVKR